MQPLIPGMRGSLTHRMSAELYQRHHDAGQGLCTACGQHTPCPARRHAQRVIVAAGDDPRAYDARPAVARDNEQRYETHRQDPQLDGRALFTYTGYHLTGRARALDPRAMSYEREDQ